VTVSGVVGATVGLSTDFAHSGSKSVRVNSPKDTVIRFTSSIVIGKRYRYSVWVYIPIESTINYIYIEGIGASVSTSTKGQWVNLVAEGVATRHDCSIFQSGRDSGFVYFDNFSVQQLGSVA
jgi:hypothetical protein